MEIFKLDVLGSEIAVSFEVNEEDATQELSEFIETEIEDTKGCRGYAVANFRKVGVWLGPDCQRGDVIHESYHATHRLLKEIGSEATDEELNAHIMEYICENILDLWYDNV